MALLHWPRLAECLPQRLPTIVSEHPFQSFPAVDTLRGLQLPQTLCATISLNECFQYQPINPSQANGSKICGFYWSND